MVIFLDDLQWVDSATLDLLQLLMTNPEVRHLLIIGAYRDNEVDSSHPLLLALSERQKENVVINRISLSPLGLPHINELLVDTLNSDLQKTQQLAQLVFDKTAGNPFFINEFLKSLYETQKLTFELNQGIWQWDIAQIQTMDMTNNVVELMAEKIQQLPMSTQSVLKLAACIGHIFDLKTLSTVYEKSPIDTAHDIWDSLAQGVILPVGEAYRLVHEIADETHINKVIYRFSHDRVQQAAYSLISEAEKQAVHVKIGQLLLKNTQQNLLEESIFDIVNQLNKGINLITQAAEKEKLAQLNLIAGQKAKSSNAYQPALKYLSTGITCLTTESWQQQYELTLALYQELAECEFLCSNVEQVETLFNLILHHARSDRVKVDIYTLWIELYTTQGQFSEAFQIGAKGLALLGLDFPESEEQRAIAVESGLQTVRSLLKERAISALLEAPPMTDTLKQACMRLLIRLFSPALNTSPHLVRLVTLQMVKISLESGNDKTSAYGYAVYGMLFGPMLRDYKSAYEFGQLGLKLSEMFNSPELQAKVYHIYSGFIHFWRKPMSTNIPYLKRAYLAGLESGDMVYSGFAAYQLIAHRLFRGDELSKVLEESKANLSFLRRTKNQGMLDLVILIYQLFLNLQGLTHNPQTLSDDTFDEQNLFADLQKNQYFFGLIHYYTFKLQLLFIYRNYPEALKMALATQEIKFIFSGFAIEAEYYLYHALTITALYESFSDTEKVSYWKTLETYQQQMKRWADNCPENFQHKYFLITAEKNRIEGHNWEAAELYDQAIASAQQENEFVQNQALANELAAKFYLSQGKDKAAIGYLTEAHYLYARWGASAKVKHLETRYPQFLSQNQKTARVISTNATISVRGTTASTSTSSEWLDLNSIMKAAQTLSGEIVLSRLLEKMMHLVIENAGAEKGFLLLPKQDNWFIEAEGQVDSDEITVLQSLAIEASEQVPAKIIRYVARTQENVILHDATQEGIFTQLPYIIKQRPKSVLCAPLINQGQLTGILYLENNLTTGAFTDNRLEMLNMLSSQIAISIENSFLYNNLEQKVAERTQELSDALDHLKTTQAQLVESEKMASLGGLVAGVAHEINTPIGIGLMSASTLTKRTDVAINAFKSNQLKKSSMGTYFDQVNHGSQLIVRNLERASELVKSFKQVAVDQSNLEKRFFVVKKYLEDMLVALKPKLQKTHQITLNGDEQIEINSYPGAFSQVVTNLLMNSITHAYQEGEKGKLYFDIRREAEQVIIEYSDDGCGILAENLPKIFDPFFTTGRNKGGTGLGLHITYNLVTQKLKGTIQVESTVGVGTTFIITLPLS